VVGRAARSSGKTYQWTRRAGLTPARSGAFQTDS
jgi:hypothetical protein